MASAAAESFVTRLDDAKRLEVIHEELTGKDPGRRKGVEVLNRAGIVLTTAVWEGYCEDLATEGLGHLVNNVSDPNKLPASLRKVIAKELIGDKNQLAVWSIAGNSWKGHLTTRLAKITSDRAFNWNTPKSSNVSSFLEDSIGLSAVTSSWFWPGMSVENAKKKLDKYVTLRGSIAHGAGVPTVYKGTVQSYRNHVSRLVGVTDAAVNAFLFDAVGKGLF
jgi:hypothetical protein